MKAIILAAGEGKRLRPYTLDRPKCLVELAGQSLLSRQIEVLESAGIDDINIVVGYRSDRVADLGYPTIENPDYACTNLVTSLMCAAHLLDGTQDVLISYSDIVYEKRILEALLACADPLCVTVDTSWLDLWRIRTKDPLSAAETLRLDEDGNIIELGKKPSCYADIEGQYMGLIKIRADYAQDIIALYYQLDFDRLYDGQELPNIYMTSFLQHVIDNGLDVRAVPVDRGWLEVDSASDLELYNHLYNQGLLGEFYQTKTVSECGR